MYDISSAIREPLILTKLPSQLSLRCVSSSRSTSKHRPEQSSHATRNDELLLSPFPLARVVRAVASVYTAMVSHHATSSPSEPEPPFNWSELFEPFEYKIYTSCPPFYNVAIYNSINSLYLI
jgi:hypothetical protein